MLRRFWTAMRPGWFARLVCRVRGHHWVTWDVREDDLCDRCLICASEVSGG